ncbi:MAG: hypothetical protein HYT83_01355 [Candidatus Levybacteria bacterium]|nr:hypothetical protein [Candidatus Levybacteria bacterium]
MSKSTTIDTTVIKKLINELEHLEELKLHILRIIPEDMLPYGSKLWWEKEVLNGEEEIKKGKFKTYKNAKMLIADLRKGI